MEIKEYQLGELIQAFKPLKELLANLDLPIEDPDIRIKDYIDTLDSMYLEEAGLERLELLDLIESYVQLLKEIRDSKTGIETLTIRGGADKSGHLEPLVLNVKAGEIVCIVGPTGSGKSRLLEDIELMAQGDTPTGRIVLIDGKDPNTESRFSFVQRYVAQLSQNMNFVMDITVREFIEMHADSRMISDQKGLVDLVVDQANLLTGESIHPDMPITSLSGGQSRALMIADTASLSASPIVLIDEIENAGINRKTALEILLKNDKLVFIATHDPILALMGHRRLVMKNGGIVKIIETTAQEHAVMQELIKLDEKVDGIRQLLRQGHTIEDSYEI
ncbi:MAG: ATP-binding cassette domain-containing protein [Syntrophomonadaceae bacterium]